METRNKTLVSPSNNSRTRNLNLCNIKIHPTKQHHRNRINNRNPTSTLQNIQIKCLRPQHHRTFYLPWYRRSFRIHLTPAIGNGPISPNFLL